MILPAQVPSYMPSSLVPSLFVACGKRGWARDYMTSSTLGSISPWYSLLLCLTLRGSRHVFSLYQSLISLPKFSWATVLWQSASQSTFHLSSPLLIQSLITSVKQRSTSILWFISITLSLLSGKRNFSTIPRKRHLSSEKPLSAPTLSRLNKTFPTSILPAQDLMRHNYMEL